MKVKMETPGSQRSQKHGTLAQGKCRPGGRRRHNLQRFTRGDSHLSARSYLQRVLQAPEIMPPTME